MLLLFLCPGTITVPSCRPSCQMSCCTPPSSGCTAVASSHLSTTPMTAPTPSYSVDPAPSPSGWGCGMRSSPSAASRPARKQTPCLVVCDAAADRWASAQAAPPPPSESRFQTRCFFIFSSGTAKQRSRNHFFGCRPVFCMPWTGGTIPVSTAAVSAPSAVTATEIGPLTSLPAGQR